MKRAAIIFLTLFVWFCLAPSAFAEQGKGKYMVVYIEVDSGDVAWVCGADKIGTFESEEMDVKVKKPKYHTNNGNSDGTPIPIDKEISRKTYETIFAAESPGCRYIWYNGRYVKVCN